MQRAVFVRVNRVMNIVVRRLGLRRFRGGDLLLLTTTGRRTGQQRTTPLLFLRRGSDWVVASNGGADWEPGWWLNLRDGQPGTVQLDGRSVPVRGDEVTDPDRQHLWRQLNEQVFDYEGYEAKVSRRLAVLVLTAATA